MEGAPVQEGEPAPAQAPPPSADEELVCPCGSRKINRVCTLRVCRACCAKRPEWCAIKDHRVHKQTETRRFGTSEARKLAKSDSEADEEAQLEGETWQDKSSEADVASARRRKRPLTSTERYEDNSRPESSTEASPNMSPIPPSLSYASALPPSSSTSSSSAPALMQPHTQSVCGVIGKYGQPCHRVGRICPFHGPVKARPASEEPDSDPSTFARPRRPKPKRETLRERSEEEDGSPDVPAEGDVESKPSGGGLKGESEGESDRQRPVRERMKSRRALEAIEELDEPGEGENEEESRAGKREISGEELEGDRAEEDTDAGMEIERERERGEREGDGESEDAEGDLGPEGETLTQEAEQSGKEGRSRELKERETGRVRRVPKRRAVEDGNYEVSRVSKKRREEAGSVGMEGAEEEGDEEPEEENDDMDEENEDARRRPRPKRERRLVAPRVAARMRAGGEGEGSRRRRETEELLIGARQRAEETEAQRMMRKQEMEEDLMRAERRAALTSIRTTVRTVREYEGKSKRKDGLNEKFVQQALGELEKMRDRRKHENEMEDLQKQIRELEAENAHKTNILRMLKTSIDEKKKWIDENRELCHLPVQLIESWLKQEREHHYELNN